MDLKAFMVFQYGNFEGQVVRQYFTKCYSDTHHNANECFMWYLREKFPHIGFVRYCIQQIEARDETGLLFPTGDILLVTISDVHKNIFETAWEGVNYA